jgi:protein-S-isoprenylcysteine O-methyltransferase Ste14
MSLWRTAVYSLLVPVPVTVVVPAILLRWDPEPAWFKVGWWCWLALAPIIAGAALYLWSAWSFSIAGRGTPNPADPPTCLVAGGPYRWSRNPMYVACLAMIAGECVVFASDWLGRYLAGSVILIWVLVRVFEERGLRRRYGRIYDDYCARVPRWLPWPWRIPAMRRRRATDTWRMPSADEPTARSA